MHPLFLSLIIMIIYLILFIYFFADPVLCEGLDKNSPDKEVFPSHVDNNNNNFSDVKLLKELEANIEYYTDQSNKSLIECNHWFKLYKEAINRPEKHEDIENYLSTKWRECFEDHNNYWNRAKFAKRMIKEIKEQLKE